MAPRSGCRPGRRPHRARLAAVRALAAAADRHPRPHPARPRRRVTRPRRSAFGVGFLYGLGLLGVSISWIHVLGSWIAVLLIAFEALFFGLLGLTLHLTSALRWWPLAAALCWSLIEFLYSRVPFGGFGWVRLAYAAVDTPLAGFLPLIGVAGVSFCVALVAQSVAYAVVLLLTHAHDRPPAAGSSRSASASSCWPCSAPVCGTSR